MASSTYTARVIVLRKTKLGESDLILAMLSSDGSQIRAVAKGARKPTSSFSARLELFCSCEVLLACGRNLDIVKEARIASSCGHIRQSIERASCAAPVVELLEKVSEPGLAYPKLFDMSQTALSALDRCDVDHAPALCAAHALKTFAFTGYSPAFSHCCVCGDPVSAKGGHLFSVSEGGAVCARCSTSCAVPVNEAYLSWAHALMHSTFSDIMEMEIDEDAIFGVLHLVQSWSAFHISARLKSLEFLFSCGLF